MLASVTRRTCKHANTFATTLRHLWSCPSHFLSYHLDSAAEGLWAMSSCLQTCSFSRTHTFLHHSRRRLSLSDLSMQPPSPGDRVSSVQDGLPIHLWYEHHTHDPKHSPRNTHHGSINRVHQQAITGLLYVWGRGVYMGDIRADGSVLFFTVSWEEEVNGGEVICSILPTVVLTMVALAHNGHNIGPVWK